MARVCTWEELRSFTVTITELSNSAISLDTLRCALVQVGRARALEDELGVQAEREGPEPLQALAPEAGHPQHPTHAGSIVADPMRTVKEAALAREPAAAEVEQHEGQQYDGA